MLQWYKLVETPANRNVSVDAVRVYQSFYRSCWKSKPSIVQILVVAKVKNSFKIPDEFKQFFPFSRWYPTRKTRWWKWSDYPWWWIYLAHNNHVVEKATDVPVTLYDRREYAAEIIGTDPLTDLAVIKINEKDLPAAFLGNSDEVKVGQWVTGNWTILLSLLISL